MSQDNGQKSAHAANFFSPPTVLAKKQSHKLCSSFRLYKSNTLPPHPQNQSTPTCQVICDLVMPSSASFSFPLAHRISLASGSIFSYSRNAGCKHCREGSHTGRSSKGTGLKALHVLFNKSKDSKACTVTGILVSGGQTC